MNLTTNSFTTAQMAVINFEGTEQQLQHGIIRVTDKKGASVHISVEGCIWAGGAKLAALKSEVAIVAASKAMNGKYRPSTDILGDGFPAVLKLCTAFDGPVWANKEKFTTFMRKVRENTGNKEGKFTKKQIVARNYADALWGAMFPADLPLPTEVVENV